MKALSIRQPFAALIAAGVKQFEIRTWATNYRGPLLICAAQQAHALFVCYSFISEKLELDNHTAPRHYRVPGHYFKPDGVALAVVDLVDVRPFLQEDESRACCDHGPGLYAWDLRNPRPVDQEPIAGRLGLFEVPDERIRERFFKPVNR